MNITIKKDLKGLQSASNHLISRYAFPIELEGEQVGIISGDSLRFQLRDKGFDIIEFLPKIYTEADLVTFGNFLLRKYAKPEFNHYDMSISKQEGVTHADLENWKHEQIKDPIS